MFRRLYDWVLSWSESRFGAWILMLVAFAESSFFPVPPDPLLMALSLGRPKRAFFYALLASCASILGGAFGYFIGYVLWEGVSGFFFAYIIDPALFEYVSGKYTENAFIAILGAAFTPIPYKVFTISAGVFKISLPLFIVASAIGRSARFFLEAGLIYLFGPEVKAFIDRYFNLLVMLFFLLLVLGFVVVKLLL